MSFFDRRMDVFNATHTWAQREIETRLGNRDAAMEAIFHRAAPTEALVDVPAIHAVA